MVEWRKKLAEARAEIGGDAATDIPAPGAGAAPRRVRLIITAQAPEPAAAGGVFKQIVRDFSDRSERGDPGALFGKYGGAFVPMAMGIPFTGAGGAMLVFLPPRAPHQLLPWVFGAIFTLAGLFLFTGDRFEAAFASGRRLHVTGPVRATLRCVEQVVEDGGNSNPEAHPYAIYAHSQTYEPPDARLSAFDVSFDVPGNVPGTDLSGDKPTYWLLEIRAPLHGPDFSTQFLIPIYARPSVKT
jgi:hypothetical protein